MSCDERLNALAARQGFPRRSIPSNVANVAKVGRNDPCPCGSGKKAKLCCLRMIKALAALPPHLRERVVAGKILGHDPLIVTAPPSPVPPTVEEAFQKVSGGAVASTVETTEIPASVEIPVTATPDATA